MDGGLCADDSFGPESDDNDDWDGDDDYDSEDSDKDAISDDLDAEVTNPLDG